MLRTVTVEDKCWDKHFCKSRIYLHLSSNKRLIPAWFKIQCACLFKLWNLAWPHVRLVICETYSHRVKFPRKTIAICARVFLLAGGYKRLRNALEMFLVLAGAALNVPNRFHVREFPRIKLDSPNCLPLQKHHETLVYYLLERRCRARRWQSRRRTTWGHRPDWKNSRFHHDLQTWQENLFLPRCEIRRTANRTATFSSKASDIAIKWMIRTTDFKNAIVNFLKLDQVIRIRRTGKNFSLNFSYNVSSSFI